MLYSRFLRILTTGLALASLFAGLLAFTGHAAAAPIAQPAMATITGKVLSQDNVALPNVKLAAYDQPQTNTGRTPIVNFQSDAQGNYSVQVPAGQIWLSFLTQDILGQSFWGYDNLPVTVSAGQTLSGQNFVVAIRVVSTPPTAVPTAAPPAPPTPLPPAPTPTEPPGMPTTGAGDSPFAPLAGGLGLLCLIAGLAWRRAARA